MPSEINALSAITRMDTQLRLEDAIISNGKIVNVVSGSYWHNPFVIFFKHQKSYLLMEVFLLINKPAVPLSPIYHNIWDLFKQKNSDDIISLMLLFKNLYDVSEKTSGHFGLYR